MSSSSPEATPRLDPIALAAAPPHEQRAKLLDLSMALFSMPDDVAYAVVQGGAIDPPQTPRQG